MIAVWFSCGAASAVAAKKTIERYSGEHEIRVINNPVIEEDSDNLRFMREVEEWIGVKIETATNDKFPNASAREIWEKRKYMAGQDGAPCTYELKKQARYQWEEKHKPEFHVLGFTADPAEVKRYQRFILTERDNVLPVLIDAGITKLECFKILHRAGIKRPRIYDMGYPNANCIGCVKAASPAYWNNVRRVHPEIFADRAEQSRRLGAKLWKTSDDTRYFLDELPENFRDGQKEMDFDCGNFCEEKPTNG